MLDSTDSPFLTNIHELTRTRRTLTTNLGVNVTMPHCCVPMCNNSGLKVKKGECSVTFHQFPKEKRERKEWIVKILRDEGPEFQVRLTVRRPVAHTTPPIHVRYD